MHANEPEMAKKWEKEEKMKKETKVRQLIRKMVREIMSEDFAGAYPKEKRASFDKKRQKQAEVFGYKLTGHPDVKTEIDDATIKEGKTLWELTEEYVNEGKWSIKGKYLNMPDGEESSIPGNYGRDAIAVGIKNDTFKIYMQNGKLYAAGNKYDKFFKNGNDLTNWLNKNKAKYVGIDNR